MLTVEDYGRIRRAHRDGMSIREIARSLHHSRRKIREALATSEPKPYTRAKPVHAPKLGPFHAVIDQILADEDTNGDVLWPLADHQGSVRDLADSDGVIAKILEAVEVP